MRLTRAQQSRFNEYQKLLAIRNYITANARQFVAGNEVHTTAIFKEFDIVEPSYEGLTPREIISSNRAFENKRTKFTKRFNKILAERGMFIKKKTNEDYWCIQTNEKVIDKIERIYNVSRNTQRDALTLEVGYENHGNSYSRVPNATLKRIAARTRRR